VKTESEGFASEDVQAFLDGLVDHERCVLIERLERASQRLGELGARVRDNAPAAGDGWSPKDVLAHIAVLSRFYGVLAYRIGNGQMTDLRLLDNVQQRDVFGGQMARLPVADLVAEARQQHQRTLEYLRSADMRALQRACRADGRWTFTTADMARLPLVAHLELHLEQLERALAAGR
jgi:DinB superfamily